MVTTGAVTPGLQALAAELDGVALRVVEEPLAAWMRRRRHGVLVLRPDRAVLAAARDERGVQVPLGLLSGGSQGIHSTSAR